jgi:hypothetical protein
MGHSFSWNNFLFRTIVKLKIRKIMIQKTTIVFALSMLLLTAITHPVSAQVYLQSEEYGGNYDDEITATVVDDNNNLYMVGNYIDSIDLDPSANTAIHRTVAAPNAFIARYDSLGNYLWSNSINSKQLVTIRDIELSRNKNYIYVVGDFMDTASFQGSSNTFASNGVFDVFIAKYDTAGVYQWAISFGGPAPDWGYDIVIDNLDNVYVTGSFLVFTDFDPGAGTASISTIAGSPDIFLAKYDLNGNYVWAKSAGSNGFDEGLALDIDLSGMVYLTGFIGGTSTFDMLNVSNNGSNDIFLAQYDSNGNAQWAKNFGGPGSDRGTDVKWENGVVYLCGNYVTSAKMDVGISSPHHTAAGASDIVIGKYDNLGNYLWSKSIGGIADDKASSLELDARENILLAGSFQDTADFATGIGAYRIGAKGSNDAFMAKYDSLGHFIWAHAFGGINSDEAINIDASAEHLYLSGSFSNEMDMNPDTAQTVKLIASGNSAGFIAKYELCYGNHHFDTLQLCSGVSAAYHSNYSFSESGDHHLRLVDPAGCDTLVTLHVEMYDTVDVRIMQVGTLLRVVDTSASIQWYDCAADTILSGETDTSYTASFNGSFAAIIQATTGCIDTSACIPITTVGIEKTSRGEGFVIYPNPTDKNIQVLSPVASGYRLFNQGGQLLKEGVLLQGKNTLQLEYLPEGVYLLQLTASNRFEKVIITR